MAAHKGIYTPKNPHKYIGKNLNHIVHRSSWELSLFLLLDSHPYCLGWCSESITIPYLHPMTRRWTMYVPDVLVIYEDKHKVRHTELIEVKPKKEVPVAFGGPAASGRGKSAAITEARQIVNSAKWGEAIRFCQKRNWSFRIMTEDQLFDKRPVDR